MIRGGWDKMTVGKGYKAMQRQRGKGGGGNMCVIVGVPNASLKGEKIRRGYGILYDVCRRSLSVVS